METTPSAYNDTNKLPLPVLLEIEPALGCNLSCIMCHVAKNKEKAQFMDLDAFDRHTKTVRDCHVIIGSYYEPTIHPEFDKLLRISIDREWKIDLQTNGINLHRYSTSLLSDVNFNVFNVSFDGCTKDSYERIRRGANFEKALERILRGAEICRKKGGYTAVNATLLDSNLHEAADMVRMWDREGFDLIRLLIFRLRDPKEELFAESLYPKRNELASTLDEIAQIVADEQLRIGVRCGYYESPAFAAPPGISIKEATISSKNPNYRHVPGVRQESQAGCWPGGSWPCKSPYVYARIKWDGSVDLCNKHDFVVGNICNMRFEDIWYGAEAMAKRKEIHSNASICESCSYYRLCINIHHLDIHDVKNHFVEDTLNHPRTKEFLK